MPKAASISIEKLSSTVSAAVKAALEKHPRIKVDPAGPVALSYLIWGIPVPDAVAGDLTLRDTQAFANDVAAKLGDGLPGVALEAQHRSGRAATRRTAVFSRRGHLIIGIPVPPEVLITR